MPGLTETIAQFIAQSSLQDLPRGAIDNSKRVLADTFAVILAGAGSEVAEPLLRYARQTGSTGPCPILGTKHTASAETAALVNGTFGHALDFDDVLTMMPGHPSAIIVAAVLAAAGSTPCSGRDLLEAHIIGIEVGAKIGLAITHGHYERGFHGTGTLGIFSALAALAKFRKLDVDSTRIAFGIASSMASGVRRNFGTMTKPLHTGWAARSALTAIELAGCGFSAAPDALEAKAGFFASYGVDGSDPQVACSALGKPWTIVDPGIGLKKWPCYNGSQRGMHGVLQLREQLGFDAESLERLECRMPPGGMNVVIYPRPRTGLEGKFSLQYVLAAGVLDGAYSLRSFTDEAVRRPEIAALYEKIDAHEDPRCGGNDPQLARLAAGARGFVEVEARLKDGRRRVLRVDAAPGHPRHPLSWNDLEQKFSDCAAHGRIAPAPAVTAFNAIRQLQDCPDLAAIVTALSRSPA
jgi:2-methylcitrate dehydratase PrpD